MLELLVNIHRIMLKLIPFQMRKAVAELGSQVGPVYKLLGCSGAPNQIPALRGNDTRLFSLIPATLKCVFLGRNS